MPSVPPLYKYVVPERADVLQHLRIRFTPPDQLNDPFDSNPFVSDAFSPAALASTSLSRNTTEWLERNGADILAELGVISFANGPSQQLFETSRIAETLNSIKDPDARAFAIEMSMFTARTTLQQVCGVLSLTERPANILMWTHYAANHRGLVLGFDGTHRFFSRPGWTHASVDLAAANRVMYSRNRPEFRYMTDVTKTAAFLTKSLEWEYECEWRMLRTVEDTHEIKFINGQEIWLFELPADAVWCVVLGAAATRETETTVRNTIRANRELNHVALYRASIDSKLFRINLAEIPR